MLSLPFGCRCSDLKVFPSDYLEKDFKFDRKIEWYVFYRFYEPGRNTTTMTPQDGFNNRIIYF